MSSVDDTGNIHLAPDHRPTLVRRGQFLSRITLAYNLLEGIVSLVAGLLAGSISLVGFGADSMMEVSSSLAALWRLRSDHDEARRGQVEALSVRIIGLLFLLLALYIVIDAGHTLYLRQAPEISIAGIIITAASVIIMPVLARAKKDVAIRLGSRALSADATQTNLCMWLSSIVLVGLILNALLGWWWADPVAALCMTPIIAKEGLEFLKGESHCDDCA